MKKGTKKTWKEGECHKALEQESRKLQGPLNYKPKIENIFLKETDDHHLKFD